LNKNSQNLNYFQVPEEISPESELVTDGSTSEATTEATTSTTTVLTTLSADYISCNFETDWCGYQNNEFVKRYTGKSPSTTSGPSADKTTGN
jgi:hypothetical protein